MISRIAAEGKKSQRHPSCLTAWFVLSAAFFSAGATAAERQWVHASWAEVRSEPKREAETVAHWSTNTPVLVTKRVAEWCHASVTPDSGVSAGYVACNELGGKPLILKELKFDDEQGGAERRAFWIAPSVERLLRVGERLNSTAWEADQKRYMTDQSVSRPPNAEFEAMKLRLAGGVVPVAEQELARIHVATLKTLDKEALWQPDLDLISTNRKHLPAVKPSLFRRHGEVVVFGEGMTDTLAAMLGQPNEVRFEGKPEWVAGHHSQGVSAIWDFRQIEVRYAQPVTLHSISATGLVGARTIPSTTRFAYSEADGCQDGFPPLPDGLPAAGYPQLKDHPLVSFFLPKPMSLKKIDVLSRKSSVTSHKERPSTVHTLDLDQDGIPDLAVVEVIVPGAMDVPFLVNRIQFVNVAGEWWYAVYESYGECT